MSRLIVLVFALAMGLTFFGKSIIGIGLGICVILSAITLFQNRREIRLSAFLRSKEWIGICVITALWLVSGVTGLTPENSVGKTFEMFGMMVGGFLVYGGLTRSENPLATIFKVTVMTAAFCSAYLLLSPVLGDMAREWSSSYASVLCMIMPMAVYLLATDQRRAIFWVLCMGVMAAAMFATGGRTGWVALIGLFIVIPFLMPFENMRHRLRVVILAVIVIAIGAVAGLQSYRAQFGGELYSERVTNIIDTDRPASGRLVIWKNSLPHIIERPFFGYGIKGSFELGIDKGNGAKVLHVHNAVIELLLDTGALGLAAVIGLVMIFVLRFLAVYRRCDWYQDKAQAMAVFLSVGVYAICSLSLTSFFHAWWFLYGVALLILLRVATDKLLRVRV